MVVSESNAAFIVRSSLSSVYVDASLSCRRHISFLFYSRPMLMEIMGPPDTNVANLTETVDLEQKGNIYTKNFNLTQED